MSTSRKQQKNNLEMLTKLKIINKNFSLKNVLSMEDFQRCFRIKLFLRHMEIKRSLN